MLRTRACQVGLFTLRVRVHTQQRYILNMEGSDLELNSAKKLLDGEFLSLQFSICEEDVTEVAKQVRAPKGQVTCDMNFER